jgi:ComF family protein
LVIPVPLHPKKQHKRGFNQSKCIADGISKAMKTTVVTNKLVRTIHTSTQTKKSRESRWDNVKNAFEVYGASTLENQHILLVDDVLTTGATLESCARKLLEIPGVRVSVATLAYALV